MAAALGVAGVEAPQESKLPWLHAIKTDLEYNVGRAVVVAGPRQPAEVHALVAAINHKLGNIGKTVVYYPDPQPKRPSHAAALEALVNRMKTGEIATLLILGGNPAYNAPENLKFAEALKKVRNTVHLALHEDETSRLCTWRLSRAHYLESWGDARTFDGTVSIVQPLIEPLKDGRSPIELLSLIVDEKPRTGYDIVRETVKSLVGNSFTEYRWKKLLANGVIEGTEWKPARIEKLADGAVKASTAGSSSLAKGQYELVFYTDKVYDGRFANNGWLQELPDPMTRLTWDNAAVMSKKTADDIRVNQDELVALTVEGAKVLAPVFFLPGLADGVIGLALGYGRTLAGHVGSDVGQNAYTLRTTADLGWRSVKAEPTGKKYRLATVQDHHIVDRYGKEAVKERIPELLHEVPLAKAYEGRREQAPHVDLRRAQAQRYFAGLGRSEPRTAARSAQVGHGGRSDFLHRLRGVRRRLPGGEQHSHRRQGASAARPRDALDPHRPLFPRHAGRGRGRAPAGAVHAVRERPVRVGLSGGRHHAQPGRPQHDDLQPLRGHPLLLEQLPLQGAAVQLLRLQPRHAHRRLCAQPAPPAGHRTDQDAEEPRRDAFACGA